MKLVFQITLGILLASTIGAVANLVATYYIAYQANQFIQQKAEQQQAAFTAKNEADKKRRIEAYKQTYLAEQSKQAQREREQVERRRYTLAWKSYYVMPKGCESYQDEAHMVECVNHKLDAKKEFELIYAKREIITPASKKDGKL